MEELIKREDAIEAMAELQGIAQSKAELTGISKAWKRIKALPTVDAVPVVRCGECKYCIEVFHQTEEGIYPLKNICHKGHGFGSVKDDWFCADGKRRE